MWTILMATDTWEEGVVMDEVTAFGSLTNSQDTYPDLCRIRNYDALKRMSIVYTWVNGSVPCYRACRHRFGGDDAVGGSRDREIGELKYSIRSVLRFLPWFEGTVYIVTPGHAPLWLNQSHPRIHVIHQDTLIPSAATSNVPTFNTNVVEQFLYRIPGLSDLFMHFNDDYILTAHVRPHDLFTCDGGIRILHEPAIIPRPRPMEHSSRGAWMQSVLATRDAIDAKLGYTATHHFLKHAPFVYSRRAFARLHQIFSHELRATWRHRFRSPHDMNVPLLHHGYMLAQGRIELGIPADAPPPSPEFQLVMLTDTNQDFVKRIFAAVLRRQHGAKLLALNDEYTDMAVVDTVRTFLAAFLPDASPFELDEEAATMTEQPVQAMCCARESEIEGSTDWEGGASSNSIVLRAVKPPSMALAFFRAAVEGAGFAFGLLMVLAVRHQLRDGAPSYRHPHTEEDGDVGCDPGAA
ncbi:hypothetical protein DYB32_008600 [Aphanomyces invadans]|uniref:Stealth protein CR2 conserved region 2 domain-containing protein n=1 Tax=Aphanomyces invadans TaxID=157072 RepID=A0A3R7CV77_9STRA|nr:hypothetical protein DYB32_008600 [Aphanomyces invadans]